MSGPPPPQRVPADTDGARALVADVTELLERTIARAASFSEQERHQRVDDEWSTVESIRHIVFVIDIWLGRLINGEEDPFHPIGLPPHFAPRVLPGSSIDADADPSFDEACDVLSGRLSTLRTFVDGLDQADLERPNSTHAQTLAGALGVIFDELTFHDGFMNRDLDAIEASRG
jgi:hypothetical protein